MGKSDEGLKEQIVEKFNIPEELAEVLIKKGVTNIDLAEATFNPVLENLQPPSTLPNLYPAVDRILRGVGKKENILVFGHEDADGITSTVILLKAIKQLGGNASHYIPSKKNEGYGLQPETIDEFKRRGVQLIVTVDSCSSCIEGVEYAKKAGIDVVITDHHELPDILPDTYIVNPKVGGGSFRYLAGVGVSFKVAWELLKLKLGWDLNEMRNNLPEFFVLTMVGTIADRVPPFCENRIFINEGRKLFDWFNSPYLKAYESYKKQKPSIENLISIISAGKSTNGENVGVKLLMAQDPADAEEYLIPILDAIDKWQKTTQELLEEAKKRVKRVRDYIVIDMENVEPQYLGFLASQLKDAYGVPTIVLGRKSGGKAVAEVRAPYGFNSLDVLNELAHLFIDYGGHAPASGFSLDECDVPELIEELEIYFKNNPFNPGMPYSDLEVNGSKNKFFFESLARLGELGVDLRVLFKGVKLGEIKENLKGLSVIDTESLLDLYPADKSVAILLVSSPQGIRVEKLLV